MAGAVGAGGIGNVSVAYGFILFKNQIQTIVSFALPILEYSLWLAS